MAHNEMFTSVNHCCWIYFEVPVMYRNVVLYILLLVSHLLNHPNLWIWNRIFHMVCKHSYYSRSYSCNNITSSMNTIHNIIFDVMYKILNPMKQHKYNKLFVKLLETRPLNERIWQIPAMNDDNSVSSEKWPKPTGPSTYPPTRLRTFYQVQVRESSRWGTEETEISCKADV